MGQQVLIDSDSLTAIADAIRAKTNQDTKFKPAEMPAAINNIPSIKNGGFKVNITQSDHQTIKVNQSDSFTISSSGGTIDDFPTIEASITAAEGYEPGELNHDNFTFSNDVREVNISATPAHLIPDQEFEDMMNVFVANPASADHAFFITSGTKVVNNHDYGDEVFTLEVYANGESDVELMSFTYGNNYYNLNPNAKYKITALKIGDTSLSADDLVDGKTIISPLTTTRYGDNSCYINADFNKSWVKSVYKQCTGKELELRYVDTVYPKDLDNFMQNGTHSDAKDAYLGEQIANSIFIPFGYEGPTTSDYVRFDVDVANESFADFVVLSKKEQEKYSYDVDDFMAVYPTIFRDDNLVQGYYANLEALQKKYANDKAALNILKQYNPATNEQQHGLSRGFATLDFTNTNPNLFELTYWIDPSDKYGFLASLPGGNAYVLWLFYARYVAAELFMAQSNNRFAGFTPIFEPADPIISTIPVSITFTKVTQ